MASSSFQLPPTPDPTFLDDITTYKSYLGYGFFGIVLEGIDKSNKSTAIKFMFQTDDQESRTIIRECTTTINLQHPNLVQILNFTKKAYTFTEAQALIHKIPASERPDNLLALEMRLQMTPQIEPICIQMQICGENLRKWLNKDDKKDILFYQIAITTNLISGLKYLHDKKVIHRDLKPENVMFSEPGYKLPIKIGDFGLSRKIHSEESVTGALTAGVGSPTYMAPEVRSGSSYSQQADLYSLGLIIWEAVQLIGSHERLRLFERLVIDKEENLIVEHPELNGVRGLIAGLTKRNPVERISLNVAVNISNWDVVQSEMTARNTKEFQLCLNTVKIGGTIYLVEGTYEGPFVLRRNGVTIVGKGPQQTMITSKDRRTFLQIDANDCKISWFKVIGNSITNGFGIELNGSRNAVKNVNVMGGRTCIFVSSGENNTLKKLALSNAGNGIEIKEFNNKIDKVAMENIENYGIMIGAMCDKNNISNLTMSNVKNGILVRGSHNNLSNIDMVAGNSNDGGRFLGLYLSFPGGSNTVEHLTCSGYLRENKDWGVCISSHHDSTVRNSQCGPVLVNKDAQDIILSNVDCGELIQIHRYSYKTTLINCRGRELNSASNSVITKNCQFQLRSIQ